MNAIRMPSGVMLGPQLPQASTSASPVVSAASTSGGGVGDHRPHPRWLIRPRAAAATARAARAARARCCRAACARRSGQRASARCGPAGTGRAHGDRIGQRVPHPREQRPVELPDRGDGEVALPPVEHRVGHEAARRPLQHPLAAVRELQLGRHGGGELDEVVVEERHAGLETPGHRHLVDALHRVLDEHHGRVDAERGVDRGLGAVRGEPVVEEAAGRVVRREPSGVQQLAHRGPRAVGEHRGVRIRRRRRGPRRPAAGTTRSRRAPRPRPAPTARPSPTSRPARRGGRRRRSRGSPSARPSRRSPRRPRPAGGRWRPGSGGGRCRRRPPRGPSRRTRRRTRRPRPRSRC